MLSIFSSPKIHSKIPAKESYFEYNPLVTGVNLKDYSYLNKPAAEAAALIKYVCPFSGH